MTILELLELFENLSNDDTKYCPHNKSNIYVYCHNDNYNAIKSVLSSEECKFPNYKVKLVILDDDDYGVVLGGDKSNVVVVFKNDDDNIKDQYTPLLYKS